MRDYFNSSIQGILSLAHPNTSRSDLQALYEVLLQEELQEYLKEPKGSLNAYKELLDVLWVLLMLSGTYNFDVDNGLDALSDEFGSKFTQDKDGNPMGEYNENGKLLKGKNFKSCLPKLKELYDSRCS